MNETFSTDEIWPQWDDTTFEACAKLLLNHQDPNGPRNQLPWDTELSPDTQP